MTPNEIQMLIVGAALGMQAMNCLHIFWNVRDERRHARRAAALSRTLAADQYLNSLRLYRLQHRSPA